MEKKLEIAVTSVRSARQAALGGADRLELCSNLDQGGLTPSLGLVQRVKAEVDIPVFVLIRPRKADFFYTEAEFEVMKADIIAAKAAGADGIVSGLLLPDGNLDLDRTATLLKAAAPLPFTFHRAFDMCLDPSTALHQLIDLGVARILSSGQKATAIEGKEMLAQLVAQAAGNIIFLAGGGVRPGNINQLLHIEGLNEFHSSAKNKVKSQMIYKGATPMGSEQLEAEFEWHEVDVETVRKLRAELDPKNETGGNP